jgi:putative nucleotidyltransferase with HDIG domain
VGSNVEGFRIGKKGSSMENVLFDSQKISLLARGDGVEVLLETIEKDRLFYIYPADDPHVLEFYLILSGEIECEYNDEKVLLGPQDYFTAKGITETIHFTALSNVTFLWVITEPTFANLSNNISSLKEIVKKVEVKDRYTYLHSDRVANYSIKIAKKMKLNRVQVENLNASSTLHDIGKIHVPKEILNKPSYIHDIGKVNVPEEVLNKPSRLTVEEFDIIKKHPSDGAEMIKGTFYEELAPIIEQHHERLNGSGYPKGLKGDDILLEARIIAVSDTFDAMTEDRVYRKASNAQEAFNVIKSSIGTLYDKEVVEAFEKVLKEEGKIL